MTFLIIYAILYFVGIHIGFYKIYEKAGESGWKAFVPFLSMWTRIEITGRPKIYMLYFFIPIVNVFCWYYTIFDLTKSFGKTSFLDSVKTALIPFYFLPKLGFSDEKYQDKASNLPKIEKSTAREWADAIAFAIVAATLIRALIMEAFTIPTSSMEKSLLVGDFLFVSKFHYGARTPATPLQIPFTHQKVPGINMKSYSDLIQLPQFRLPGLSDIERNDVVVFNIPPLELNEGIERPIDLKTNYIKRCVAIPGDVLEIKDRQVIVNGTPSENPELRQYEYRLEASSIIRERVLNTMNISEISAPFANNDKTSFSYIAHLNEEQVKQLNGQPFIKSIELVSGTEGEREGQIYPMDKNWNGDWYGPITIPSEGMTIDIDKESIAMYGEVIKNYEHNQDVQINDNNIVIDGKEITQYTFKQNYYFMMGDNRHNSLDSRYWGFVPEDHVVGKAFFIWLSLDKNKSLLDGKIRWDRFLKMIH